MTDKETAIVGAKTARVYFSLETASSVDTANMHTNEVMKTFYQAKKISGNTKATLKGRLGGLISFHRHILKIDKCHKH